MIFNVRKAYSVLTTHRARGKQFFIIITLDACKMRCIGKNRSSVDERYVCVLDGDGVKNRENVEHPNEK